MRYAAMAEANWRRDAPEAYAKITDKPAFFRELGEEAQRQVDAMLDAAPTPDGDESFLDRANRMSAVQAMADEIVARELLTPPQPPVETLDPVSGMPLPEPESPEDVEIRQALTDFQDALTEWQARQPAPEPTTPETATS